MSALAPVAGAADVRVDEARALRDDLRRLRRAATCSATGGVGDVERGELLDQALDALSASGRSWTR